jgi:hypothetical protein
LATQSPASSMTIPDSLTGSKRCGRNLTSAIAPFTDNASHVRARGKFLNGVVSQATPFGPRFNAAELSPDFLRTIPNRLKSEPSAADSLAV